MGDFVISPLPRLLTKALCAAGPLCSTGVAPFQRYYGPSRHRLVFDRFLGASGYAVYLAPSISRRDEDGFSSCLACPCHRAVPTTPPEGCARRVQKHERTHDLGPLGRCKLLTRWAFEYLDQTASTTETMLSGNCKTARMVAHYSAGAATEVGAVKKYL